LVWHNLAEEVDETDEAFGTSNRKEPMDYPREVFEIVRQCCDKYPQSVATAVERATKLIKAMPVYDDLIDLLIRNAIQDLVYDARHYANVANKKQMGLYGGPGKVVSGRSRTVNRIADSVYLWRIGGTVLGKLLGKELIPIAESESSIADGHAFNARLCQALAPLVAEDKTVEQCVPEKKLLRLFRKLLNENAASDNGETGCEIDNPCANGRRKTRKKELVEV